MTVAEMAKIIGREALVRVDAFEVLMVVMDAKQAYGNTRLLVTPKDGRNTAWVDSSRVTVITGGAK